MTKSQLTTLISSQLKMTSKDESPAESLIES
jgi:hypothetical protein